MKSNRIIKKQNGGSAVEFSIILPLLLLLVFGLIEWSLYMFNDHILTNASRTGARLGIVQSPKVPEDEIRSVVHNYCDDHLVTFGPKNKHSLPTVTVTVTGPGGTVGTNCMEKNEDLEVTATYVYKFLLLPSLTFGAIPEEKTITARTAMRCE